MKRALIIVGVVAAGLIAMGALAIVVLTGTDRGREFVRRSAVRILNSAVHGQVSVGRIEGNVLGSFALTDVVINDSAGAPFLSVARLTASLDANALWSKRVRLSGISLLRPVIYITRGPNEPWNFARIFPSSTPDAETMPGFGSWIALRDVTLQDGTLVVQQPWSPDSGVVGAARDGAVTEALAGRARVRVDRAGYGLRQTMDFTDIDGHLARLIVASPDSAGISAQVDTLSMIAAPFHAPTIAVRQFAGAVHVGDDSVTARGVVLRLPDTRATGSLAYVMASGDILTSLSVDTVAFADIRAIYPPLPPRGGGRMELQAAIRTDAPSEFVATAMRVHMDNAHAEGALGLTIDDSTTRFHDTDLRFVRVTTALVERLAPNITSPVAAEFSGRARVAGALDSMQADINATVTVERQPPFHVTALGGLGIGEHVTAQQLRITGNGIPMSLAREFDIDQPVGGTVQLAGTISGSSATRFRGTVTATHREAANVSRLTATGSVAVTGDMPMDLNLKFNPVALALAEHWLPDSIDVQGDLTGTARVVGTRRNIKAQLDLQGPAGGTVVGDVSYQLPTDTVPVFGAALRFASVDMKAVVPSLPRSALNGSATLDARGTALATLSAGFTATLGPSTVDTVEFVAGVLRGGARDGLLQVDTLFVESTFATASANGTFGLAEGKQGTLRVRAEVPDLNGLAPWIATGDTGTVTPRPARALRIARAFARSDSVQLAKLTEDDPAALLTADLQGIERPRRIMPREPALLRRDVIAGSIVATGQVDGGIGRMTAKADVQTPGLILRGNQVGAGALTAMWHHDSTTGDSLDVTGKFQTLQLEGFEFDSTRFHVRHANNGTGQADIAVFLGDSATESSAAYRAVAGYTLRTTERDGELRVRDLFLRADSTTWRATREGVFRWSGDYVAIDSLELRDGDRSTSSRIFVNGMIPARDAMQLEVEWDRVALGPWIAMLQSDLDADGLASLRVSVQGTRASPTFKGQLSVTDPTYKRALFPPIRAAVDYAERSLKIDADVTRPGGVRLARVSGTIPMDLSMGDSVTTRFPDAAVALVIEGDSIPLSPLAEFTDQLANVAGRAFGRIAVSGTVRQPQLAGAMSVVMDSARLTATNVAITNVHAHMHMVADTMVLDSLVGRSHGTISGSGSVILAELTKPVLRLRVESRDALIVDDSRGKLYAESQITVDGPLDTLAVEGRITVTRGVINIPEPDSYHVLKSGDPAIFAVVDSATARSLGLAAESSVLDNMTLNVDLRVNRGTFARSADANVEVYGDVRIRLDPTTEGKFALTGQLLTDYGDYRFMSKHFVVTRGSVRFTGGTDMNPIVQVVATYRVPQSARAPLDIRVIVGGTLEAPVITLESDAQPALSNSDLISMLAFGQSSSSLLQTSSTSGGGQAGSPLTGNAAALSAQMLGSIAIDALADKSTDELTRLTRADVVNITPGELPPELTMGGFETLLKGTEIELGRYLDRQTFLLARVRTTLVIPGASLERRVSERFKWRATYDTRFLQETPSLSTGITPRTIPVFGSMFAWTFVW